ncbi:hypothetical protein [Vibrio gazogenes]|uniref:Uncharacterized protein n=1 Tax=Vibrio gazogenes DSM 21264 = NBRC 103151 TaxID=1123492 RepID=A0A1M5AK58_VIBGA|nr:hypothetical protein [Vibrio gazogenes]USP12612.1 hypothetical protein MKS89_09115 [Vibrio gazogenes]SHF30507.1 hypothetical protein SAMN02745781_01917 [Vibrio gazogenes DSM 21264] [Vibrio gazogenes DSM 21264 = NBRC 103151]SJN57806.1 hypothetical protein BQ6471_02733 [Vibrio gazogenes]
MFAQELAALTESVNAVTEAVTGKIGQIDQRMALAEAEFKQFLTDADERYTTRKGIYVDVSGEDNKFYPVYIPAAQPGITELQISRSLHDDREGAGALTARYLLQNNGWGVLSDILLVDIFGHKFNEMTPDAVKTDGFIADFINGSAYVLGAIFWLRGGHRYLISSTKKEFQQVITHDELITTNVFDHHNIRVFKSGFDIDIGESHIVTEVKTSRNLDHIPTLEYIRGR